jgi:hypothetical protein
VNVKKGDRARIVRTNTPNDGAIVDVIDFDEHWSAMAKKPIWVVKAAKLLGFKGVVPYTVIDEGVVPDANLRRIRDDDPAIDKRERVDLDEPESLGDAVRKATETLCPTT